MKKKGKKLTFSAAVISAALGLAGCSDADVKSLLQPVGDDFSQRIDRILNELVGDLENYVPDDNLNEEVYGPPEEFVEYLPEQNVQELVYGPPEMYGPEDETPVIPETEDDLESSVDFDPSENMVPAVYGPPEDM